MVPNPYVDLTTLANVKSWLSAYGTAPANSSDDANIQACITTASIQFMWMTGRGASDGSIFTVTSPPTPIVSPFVQPVQYSEWYDGEGKCRMFLKNYPIISVESVSVGFQSIPQSTGWGNAGFVIDGSGVSISLRSGGSGLSFSPFYPGGYGTFCKGLQNIHVLYTAGYPSTPPDIELAIRKWVALNYKRKDWIGLDSKSMGQGAGSTRFTKEEFDTEVQRLVDFYSRVTPIF